MIRCVRKAVFQSALQWLLLARMVSRVCPEQTVSANFPKNEWLFSIRMQIGRKRPDHDHPKN